MDLSFKDNLSRSIKLRWDRIKHIGEHMQLSNKIHIIENVLKYPDIISKDDEREGIVYYQKYLKDEDTYFIIVIKLFNEEGLIITIYKSRKPRL